MTLVLALALVLAGVNAALAAVWTDQSDYQPGSTVTIYGDNSDGAGYLAGEPVLGGGVGPERASTSPASRTTRPPTPTAPGRGSSRSGIPRTRLATIPTPPPASRPTCRRAGPSRMHLADPQCEYRPEHGGLRLDHHGACYPADLLVLEHGLRPWASAVGKQLEFGFSSTAAEPGTGAWVSSTTPTDANGQATAK